MTAFESVQRALRDLTRVSPYSYMVMRDKIGLYFQNALVARVHDKGADVEIEFNEATQKDSRDAILEFLAARGIPHHAVTSPSTP